MATHKSAAKRHRQSLKRNERNRQARQTIRTAVKKAQLLAEKGEVGPAKEAARAATRLIDKAATKGLLKKNTASRSVSRLTARVSKAAAQ